MSTISESSRNGIARRVMALTVAVATTGLLLAACSTNSSGTPSVSGNSTTTTSSGGASSSSTSSSTTGSSGLSATARLAALSQSVQSAKNGSYKLGYTESSSASGASHMLLFEQMPPKYLFSVAGTTSVLVINTGKGLYTCSSQAGHEVCVLVPEASDFTPLLDLVSGATVLSAFNGLRSDLAAKLAGVSATFSSATFAGQASECVSGVKGGDIFKDCVTDTGVLAYAGGSTSQGVGSLTLSSYSSSPSASDFDLPAGATVVTS